MCLVLMLAGAVRAHGVALTYEHNPDNGVITVTASYDTGAPLPGAQVAVFAPDDLLNPHLTGLTDEAGAYQFTPDYALEGIWDVQIRQAGHGGLVSIMVTADMQAQASPVSSLAQTGLIKTEGISASQLLMAALVVLILVGIAYRYRPSDARHPSPQE